MQVTVDQLFSIPYYYFSGQEEGELVDSHLKEIESRKDRIETIKSKISIMYEQSQIPSFERPSHVKRFNRKPLKEDMVNIAFFKVVLLYVFLFLLVLFHLIIIC